MASDESPIGTLYIDESVADHQIERLRAVKASRNPQRVDRALQALRAGAAGTANLMPLLLDAVRAYATVGEMCGALREVWGEYCENPII